MRYDGTQDPLEHLTAFEARINLEGVGDEGSVTQFSDISHAFLAQFTTRIAKAKHPINLLGVTQRIGEPTRKYLDRFNDECLEIDGLTDSVASLCLRNGLLNEDFRKHLTTRPVWTMQEIQCVAKEYINDEEVSQVVAANKRQPPTTKPGTTMVEKDKRNTLGTVVRARRQNHFPELGNSPTTPPSRHRSRRPRATRRRQEPERENHGLTVVNVVTARNSAPRSKSAQKKDGKVLALSSSSARSSRGHPSISFGPEDQWFDEVPESPPMVITARVGTGLVKRILVDTGADSNIMFRNVFDALGLRDTDLATHQHGVVGLGDHFIKPDGIISLPTSLGQGQRRRTVMADFVVLRDSTAYNIILGRKTINDLGAAISTKLLVMKFVTDDGSVGSIRRDLETAVACDHASLSLRKKSKEASGVFLADLDARIDDKPRPEPEGDLEKFRVGDGDEKFTFINRNLPHE
ncbi:uncharacterized protein LOC107616388 [Arachis ipaensis]|uniref:uncharacterized protein LOC107616388 n=1 Tax=Arachis ipaensis TaxID=130454 RepID=UPI0007AEF2A6|nr:uncharacterized protein LOC107616388 [Arachis ipaensis]